MSIFVCSLSFRKILSDSCFFFFFVYLCLLRPCWIQLETSRDRSRTWREKEQIWKEIFPKRGTGCLCGRLLTNPLSWWASVLSSWVCCSPPAPTSHKIVASCTYFPFHLAHQEPPSLVIKVDECVAQLIQYFTEEAHT